MSDSKKPTVSEIRAREQAVPWTVEAIAEFMKHAKTDIPYLLDLVKRMGKALARFSSEFPVPGCGYCTITIEPDGKVTHEARCPIPEARALLEELGR